MPLKETIVLDATVQSVINNRAFRVVLDNGHAMVGFRKGEDVSEEAVISCGSRVTLEISPYDMTRGRIVAYRTPEA